ncbi:MAG: hypothetical protein V4732_12290 [Pseudomonadota bacterium]
MQQTKKRTHIATEDKHEILRSRAREEASAALPMVMRNNKGQSIHVRGEVTLSGIDFKASIAAKQWASSPERLPEIGIAWPELATRYARTVPKRFELAIWHRDFFLCGLALGKPTRNGNKLRLDFIEKSPTKNSLSGVITDITIIAAEAHADAIGASQIRIMNPINEKVRNYYLNSDRGFSYDKRENFCYKDLI